MQCKAGPQTTELHRQRIEAIQQRRDEPARNRNLEQRILQLERELGQAGLAIEALLEDSGVANRDAFGARIREIDGRDGVVDGRMSAPEPEPFKPNRDWPGKNRSE